MTLPRFPERAAALDAADGLLMDGEITAAAAQFEAALDDLGLDAATDSYEELTYRVALLVRSAICQFLVGAEQEADEMLGYVDRLLSTGARAERDELKLAEIYEMQENVRFYRLRLADSLRGAPLELPITLCGHDRQVPLLPCGFTVTHP